MNTVQRLSAALLAVFLFLLAGAGGALAQTLVGPGGNYATLAGAISAIEDGSLTGDVTLQIIGNLTNEPAEIVFDDPSCDLQEVLKKAVPIDEFFSG